MFLKQDDIVPKTNPEKKTEYATQANFLYLHVLNLCLSTRKLKPIYSRCFDISVDDCH